MVIGEWKVMQDSRGGESYVRLPSFIHASRLPINPHRLVTAHLAGVFVGRWLLRVIPEKGFQQLLLAFALLASLRLLWG